MTSLRVLLATLALARAAAAQHLDYSRVVVTTTPVARSVYMLQGAGANVTVLAGRSDVTIVDVEFAALTDRLLAAVAKLTSRPVRRLVNTHWHSDHTGGNEGAAKRGLTIIAHENVRRRMQVRQVIEIEHDTTPPFAAAALPAITFPDSLTLPGDDSIVVVHVPRAHTDGDAIIALRRANVIAMGDVWFNGGYPFIDVSTGGSLDGTIAAVNRVIAMSNASTRIVPGHGPVGNRATLTTYRDMLVTVRDNLRPLAARGLTLDQVRAMKPLARLDARWGKSYVPPDIFLALAYESLSRP